MINRRSFLTRALGVAAAASSSAPAASDQLVAGFIGTGGRANRHLIPSFKLYDNVRVAALCDVYKPNLEQAAALAGGKVDTYGDYRRVLDRKDIDVVVIATPDHWHCPMVIDACQAGKDVYVEKPLSNEIDACLKAVAAARNHKRVVQVGLQQRSSAPFLEAHKIFQSGILGKVRHVVIVNPGGGVRPGGGTGAGGGGRRAANEASAPPADLDWEMFQGPAPRRPYSLQRQQNWRSYWEYGCGPLSDWGVHLLDIAHWYLSVTEPAHSAAAAYGWFNHPQDDRVPDTIDVSWQYPTFVASYSSRAEVIGTYLWGDEGVLFVNRYGYSVRPVGTSWRGNDGKSPFEAKEVPLRDEFPPSKPTFESDEAKHIRNFLECVQNRQQPVADIEVGSVSSIPTLMAGMSIRNGARTIMWNGHGAVSM